MTEQETHERRMGPPVSASTIHAPASYTTARKPSSGGRGRQQNADIVRRSRLAMPAFFCFPTIRATVAVQIFPYGPGRKIWREYHGIAVIVMSCSEPSKKAASCRPDALNDTFLAWSIPVAVLRTTSIACSTRYMR
jgi:hypothetical protein